jgi:hypothetical protein
MKPAVKHLCLFLYLICAQSALIAQTTAVQIPNQPIEISSEDSLLQKEADLEKSLLDLNINGAWDFQLTEQLLALAEIKQELGNVSEASELYNQLLLNLRVNLGLYSTDQIPIILKLVEWNLSQAEYKVADELGDWAEFLAERAFSAEDDLDKLLEGYNDIIAARLAAPRSHVCFELDLRIEDYEHGDFQCQLIRRERAEHFISAFQLQRKRVELLDQQVLDSDLVKLQQRARLAKISIMTAGIVSGTDEVTGVYGERLQARRRYDPEYYYNISFRLIRQLEREYPLLDLD